jgi:hypothetical protein
MMNMNRRKFIQVFGLGTGAIALTTGITSCGSLKSSFGPSVESDSYGWNGPTSDIKDIRLQVLAYAILSPNPHNKQPWIIKLTGPTEFELYVDQERLLPATDPYFRQIHIGQGTFLETASIAASGLGHVAKITLFPQGIYSNTQVLNKPVARVSLTANESVNVNPLFANLLSRQSNKREYNHQSLTQNQVSELIRFNTDNNQNSLTLVDSPAAKKQLEQVLTKAMKIEVGNKARDEETIKMFRFNQAEVEQYRDGFGTAQVGLSGLKRLLVENFILSRESTEKDPTEFGQQAVTMTQKTVASTGTFAWITSASNSRIDQINVGREYCRINLKTNAMGLAQHPLSQILQEYEDILPLQAAFKDFFNIKTSDTVQMLFRLGTAEITQHSPRRAVADIIQA